MIKKIINKEFIVQFFKYFGVGLVAAVINIFSLYIFADILGFNYLIANIIAFSLGLITNYLLSKRIVFKSDNINKILEFILYGIIGIIGLGIDTLFLWIFTSKFKIYYMLSKIISTGITFIWNFLARKGLYYLASRK